MKITVLSDNIGCGALQGEWGLSFHIEFNGKSILLDTGGSDRFLGNAEVLGIDISKVDIAVLSHAHYDHSRGMKAFFGANPTSAFFISPNAAENCYAGWKCLSRYIGLPKGILSEYAAHIVRAQGVAEISEGVFVVPHTTPGLGAAGRKSHMYVRRGVHFVPDDFSHEQSLVLRTDEGLVILNSCSHSGPDVVLDEVGSAFPGEEVRAYLGGLHLFRLDDDKVRGVAARIGAAGLKKLYTGHCTGERAFRILKEELGDKVEQFRCGMEIEF